MEKRVIIYRDELLPYSETFIPAQVENFSVYTGVYVGTTRCRHKGYPLPSEQTLVLSEVEKFTPRRKQLFFLTGLGYPHWFERLHSLSASLIHAHFGFDGVRALILKRRLKLPLLVTFYGYDITVNQPSLGDSREQYDFWYRFYLWQRQTLFKQVDCCIAISDFIRAKLIENGCPEDKIKVIYLGIDPDQFKPDLTRPREPVVLFVGRLVSKKGCNYLIQAMANVQAIKPELELVVIGDGKLRPDLEQQAAASLKRYRFLGAQPPEVIQSWMNRALLLSAPSITADNGNSEGLCVVTLEAQAMRLPVIASFHGGMQEAVLHNQTGLLADEGDWQAIAQHILTLAQNPDLREKFAIAGRQRVEQDFNVKRNTTTLEAIYDQICG